MNQNNINNQIGNRIEKNANNLANNVNGNNNVNVNNNINGNNVNNNINRNNLTGAVIASNTVENLNKELNNNQNIVKVVNENYPVDKNSEVPHIERWNSHDTRGPDQVPNGGLFGGPQAMGEYASIHVIPTATNMINNNLRSANPPPRATEQYPGTNRLGNNYIAMPGVYWYSDTHPVNKGPYTIKVTDPTREY